MTITYQEEFMSRLNREEFSGLVKEHWEESALHKDKIFLDPNLELYLELESKGQSKLFTVRDEGKLVGYFLVLVFKHLHYQGNTYAQNDVVFVTKEYRKGFTGIKLIKFAEECLKEDGVDVFNINVKKHKDFGPVLERLGFKPVETVYGKYIGD